VGMTINSKTTTDIIEATWFYRESAIPMNGERVVTFLQANLPEALPARFGPGDPPQRKIVGDDVNPFLTDWAEYASDEIGRRLAWTGRGRGIFGSIRFPDRRLDTSKAGIPVGALRIDLTRVLVEEHLDRFVSIFSGIATDTNAFFACAFVLRAWEVRGSVLSFNVFASEESPLPRSGRWLGLPPATPWLSWLGPEYAKVLVDSIGNVERLGNGFLIRTSVAPEVAVEMEGQLIWPEEMTAKRHDARFPKMRPSEPAAYIPDIRKDPADPETERS
jgi:hypothetical protein